MKAIHLRRNEQIIWSSHPGKNYRTLIFFRDILLGIISAIFFYFGMKEFGIENKTLIAIVTTGAFVIWLLLAAINQISMLLIKYVITNERIIIKRGWLNRNLIDIPLEHIVSTEVTQSFQERIINSGTIYIKSANDQQTDGDKIVNIDRPFRLNSLITEISEDELFVGKKKEKE